MLACILHRPVQLLAKDLIQSLVLIKSAALCLGAPSTLVLKVFCVLWLIRLTRPCRWACAQAEASYLPDRQGSGMACLLKGSAPSILQATALCVAAPDCSGWYCAWAAPAIISRGTVVLWYCAWASYHVVLWYCAWASYHVVLWYCAWAAPAIISRCCEVRHGVEKRVGVARLPTSSFDPCGCPCLYRPLRLLLPVWAACHMPSTPCVAGDHAWCPGAKRPARCRLSHMVRRCCAYWAPRASVPFCCGTRASWLRAHQAPGAVATEQFSWPVCVCGPLSACRICVFVSVCVFSSVCLQCVCVCQSVCAPLSACSMCVSVARVLLCLPMVCVCLCVCVCLRTCSTLSLHCVQRLLHR